MAAYYHGFSVYDYVVFAATIGISLGIGVYAAFTGGKQKTTSEFLVGNRELKIIPTTLSLIVSFESSIMMLGFPAEMYTYGVGLIWGAISWSLTMVFISFLMVPTFYEIKVVSVYEYLETRFQSRVVRLLGSFLGIMTNLFYMGIVLYGPATALEAVTGFKMWISVIVIAIVAIIYTTMGGIKAVIWADAFQAFIMVGGLIAIIIKGTVDTGGPENVVQIAHKGGRLEFFNFSFDPTVRITFWATTIGTIFRSLGLGTNQTSIQRISTMPTLKKAKLITLLSGPGFMLFNFLAFTEGMVAYSYFRSKECDPLEAKLISNPNQIIPFFVMELFSNYPGLPGVFLAALFSASLSTLSSGYASISAIVWSDFVKPHVTNWSDLKATIFAKLTVIVAGIASMGVAILVMQVGGPMNQISGTLLSAFSGPLAGLFLLGGMVPRSNYKGAIAAVLTSSAFSLWKGFGTGFSPEVERTPYLTPGPTTNCTFNSTLSFDTTPSILTTTSSNLTLTDSSRSPLTTFYNISYMWIGPMAIVINIIVGIVVSYATGPRTDKEIDARYLMPVCDRLFCWLPECIRSVFRYTPKIDESESLVCEELNRKETTDADDTEITKCESSF